MPKVQFISVPSKTGAKLAELGERIAPPIGILYIASYLKHNIPGIEISIIDGLVSGYNNSVSKIMDFKPDVLGVSFNTPVALSAYSLIREIKKHLPSTLIIAGGPHTTALPEECLRESGADIAAIGEGEEVTYEIVMKLKNNRKLDSYNLSQIKGIAFLNENRFIQTEVRPYIKDIDSIPFPDRNLVNMSNYRGWYLCKQIPETIMIFSRGCPFQCVFCSNKVWNISRPRVRLRSPKNIVDEIELLKKEFRIKEIFDNSDEFNNNLEHAKNICREMIKRNTGISWKTQLRAYPLDEELVDLMAKSGCWYVHLGIESGNEQTLRGIGKHITIEQVIKACYLLKKYKIKVFGLFMLFNVWEENGQLKFEDVPLNLKTLDFARKLIKDGLLNYIGWSITTPYPGSKLFGIAKKHNLFKPGLEKNWDAWLKDDFFVMQLPGIKDKTVAKIKTKGSILRGWCLLKSRGLKFKDIGYLIKKLFKLLDNELKSRVRFL
jgi:magnesium-protoporphyrin IX monomethyl ester (oxidative) cyclase